VAVPPGAVTATSFTPAAPAGEMAVMVLSLMTATLVAATPPMVTEVAPVKPDPVSAKPAPPAVVPPAGLIDVSVGAATAV
jgi:hypothetical protein